MEKLLRFECILIGFQHPPHWLFRQKSPMPRKSNSHEERSTGFREKRHKNSNCAGDQNHLSGPPHSVQWFFSLASPDKAVAEVASQAASARASACIVSQRLYGPDWSTNGFGVLLKRWSAQRLLWRVASAKKELAAPQQQPGDQRRATTPLRP